MSVYLIEGGNVHIYCGSGHKPNGILTVCIMGKSKKERLTIKLFPTKPVKLDIPARTTIWRYKQRKENCEKYEEIKKKDRERKQREYHRNRNDDSSDGRQRKEHIREKNRIRQQRYRARLKAEGINKASEKKPKAKEKVVLGGEGENNVTQETGSEKQREYQLKRNHDLLKERRKEEDIREKNRLRQRRYRARLKAEGIPRAANQKQKKKERLTLILEERDDDAGQDTGSGKQTENRQNRNGDNKGRHRKEYIREQNRIRQQRYRARLKVDGITKAADRKPKQTKTVPSSGEGIHTQTEYHDRNDGSNKLRCRKEIIREKNKLRQRQYRARLKAEGITKASERKHKRKETTHSIGDGVDGVDQDTDSGKSPLSNFLLAIQLGITESCPAENIPDSNTQ